MPNDVLRTEAVTHLKFWNARNLLRWPTPVQPRFWQRITPLPEGWRRHYDHTGENGHLGVRHSGRCDLRALAICLYARRRGRPVRFAHGLNACGPSLD